MSELNIFLPAIIASLLISTMMGCIGIFLLWRNMLFTGMALSQSAMLGSICARIAHINPLFGSFVMTFFCNTFLNTRIPGTSISKESLIAFVYIVLNAVTILLMVRFPSLQTGKHDLLGGDVLYLTYNDVLIIAAMFYVVMLVVAKMFSRWTRLSVYEQENGFISRKDNWLFYIIMVVSVSFSVRWTGLLFTFGSFLLPGMFVQLIAKNASKVLFPIIIFTACTCLTGLLAGLFLDIPLACSIVICMALCLVTTLVFKALKPFFNK